jgi:hypothetical protein
MLVAKYNNVCFIICTGPSLLDITIEEKYYINNSPHICVNRYPVFWKLIGIKPKKYIFLDDNKNKEIAYNSILNNESLDMITYRQNKYIFDQQNSNLENRCKINYTLVNMNRNRKKFADRMNSSTSLFWSSILGSAVNAATILYPKINIKILGMDGGSSTHFWTDRSKKNKLDHSSINQNHNSMNMLKWGLPIINKECESIGINVTCANANSYWVKNNYIKYEGIA